LKQKKILNFFIPKKENGIGQWLAEERISAGFPSPADDFKETRISLDRELVKNKEATFYARVSGDSMIGAGLDDGDLLVIDRSKNPENGKIAICLVDGEFTVKRIIKEKDKLYLMPENKKYKAIELKEENELIIWGVVEYVIKKV
jgi:DNA polymerase V